VARTALAVVVAVMVGFVPILIGSKMVSPHVEDELHFGWGALAVLFWVLGIGVGVAVYRMIRPGAPTGRRRPLG
jgi:uncharacterized membrane protein YozB (DUF420 family)